MKVKVTSVAFSKHSDLVKILSSNFEKYELNTQGIRYSEEELINYLSDTDAAIIGLDRINSKVLSKLPNLKVISKFGVGLDNIDMEACKQYNVEVKWSKGVNKTSVAEMALGFMLMLLRNLYTTSNELKKGNWNKSGGVQLSDKKVGVIGVGNIGKEIIRLLKPFNCEIFANDILDLSDYAEQNHFKLTSKEIIFSECDVITIHTPLTEQTRYMVNKESLKNVKPSTIIINTARGDIINLSDLKAALLNNEIHGAAIDVYDQEPPQDLKLLKIPNLINTPHIGGNAKEAVYNMGKAAIEHLINYNKRKN